MLVPGFILQSRYQILTTVHQGGVGAIYEALDSWDKQSVILKHLPSGSLPLERAFVHSARLLLPLHHAALPRVTDYFSNDHGWFLVMDSVPGPNVAALLQQRGTPFPPAEVLNWAAQLLDGLSYLHRQEPPIYHGNIRLDNLKLRPDGQVVLLGFALPRHAPTSQSRTASLEILQGAKPSVASDLYALAATLYHLLTAAPAVDALTRATTLLRGLPDPLRAIHEVNPQLSPASEAALMQALALSEQARPVSATALRRALFPPPSLDSPGALAEPSLAPVEDTGAIEMERRQLAQQLQANIIDPLNVLLAQANSYEQVRATPPSMSVVLGVLTSLARQILQQARDLEASLQPTQLEALGLGPALEALAGRARRSYGLQVEVVLARGNARLSPHVELLLLRAAQGAVERAAHQSRATYLLIQLDHSAAQVELRLADNGEPGSEPGSLRPLLQQVARAGGSAQVETSPGGGFQMTVRFSVEIPVPLTPRELEILQLLVEGRTNKEIARACGINPRTVNFHLENIYSKLGVRSRTEAAIYALRQGWVGPMNSTLAE